ncbi:hypothetical protein [Parasutterella excrementihominis]|uniref:hypothetical protein n=1 Tax=Parasutterella excrementihominis TaxID=487175 RepID=UPI003A902D71
MIKLIQIRNCVINMEHVAFIEYDKDGKSVTVRTIDDTHKIDDVSLSDWQSAINAFSRMMRVSR